MRTHRMETLACKWDGRRNLRCSPVGTLSHWSALSEVAELEGGVLATRRILYPGTEPFTRGGHVVKGKASVCGGMLKSQWDAESGYCLWLDWLDWIDCVAGVPGLHVTGWGTKLPGLHFMSCC